MSGGPESAGREDDLLADLARHRAGNVRYGEARKLAEGGMGAIFEIYEPSLRRRLAMKVIRERTRAPDEGGASSTGELERRAKIARFLDEAQITAQLSHPGVVPVHELGVDVSGSVYFTMALVRGEDLAAVFAHVRHQSGGWNRTRALGVLLRACETMAFAHEKRVIHRDLKPSNVMVGEFGEVYVMDWGLAKPMDGAHDVPRGRDAPADHVSTVRAGLEEDSSLHTLEGDVVGTPSYMSPEQARGTVLDARSDVYAMGAMLYTLLAGHPPYLPPRERPSPLQILKAIQAGPPRPLSEFVRDAPEELLAICARAMQRDAASRYPTMRELADDLRNYLEDRVVRAHRTGPWVEIRKWVRRNRGLALALGGLLLALLAGAGATAELQRRRAESEADMNTRIYALSDVAKHARLIATEDAETWPAVPSRLEALRTWRDEALGLVGRIGYHRESRERLAQRSAEEDNTWLIGQFDRLTASLAALGERISVVEARLATAESLEERTVTGAAARVRWDEAIRSLRSLPRYSGFELRPQVGLLPLGPDPESGLWEFWHVLSGSEPERELVKKRWVLREGSGLVLVLVPPGEATIGSRTADDPTEEFADPFREADEALHEGLRLDAYFVSKYETTQDQWTRIVGANPSQYREPPRWGPLHPVENFTRAAAVEAARRIDLSLPTEAQWERAARAGTTTPWSFGPDYLEFPRYGNCADAQGIKGGMDAREADADLDDGHAGHAPVGSFLPNPFGLLDVHGNVWEWCRDGNAPLLRPADGDGARPDPAANGEGTIRGGSYFQTAGGARSANRMRANVSTTDDDLGVRFVRRVE